MIKKNIKKVVLAYSGGLDTSIIAKWIQDKYKCELVTFTADLGQGEEIESAKIKAQNMGIKEIYIEDLKEEFAKNYIFPMFRANTIYEGEYLLGTSIARPLIAKRLVEIAKETGADAISHGATGKGNDQVRFEIGAYSLMPEVEIIAPWREWDLMTREKLMAYAKEHDIKIDTNKNENPYSKDANLLHTSYEGNEIEDPAVAPFEKMWERTLSLKDAPDQETIISIEYKKGDPIAINGKKMSPAKLIEKLNKLGGENGIGRNDIVENRFVGMKSRGCYETPGGTIMLKAHRAIESITLDKEASHLKDQLMPKYAEIIYNGFWWAPEREMLQALIDKSQCLVNGTVHLSLYKGNVTVLGRESKDTLFNESVASFNDEHAYDHKDAEGFIKLNALRLRISGSKQSSYFTME